MRHSGCKASIAQPCVDVFGPYAALWNYSGPLGKLDSFLGRHASSIFEQGRPIQIFLAKEQASAPSVAALPTSTPKATLSGQPINVLIAYPEASHVPVDYLFTMQPVGVLELPCYHLALAA